MKRIIILGSTGKIGKLTLEVVRSYPEKLKTVGLACRTGDEEFARQVEEFSPEAIAFVESKQNLGETGQFESRTYARFPELNEHKFRESAFAKQKYVSPVKIFAGEEGLERMVSYVNADMVLVATVGISGLKPTLAAIRTGKDVALATKEVLVLAGEQVLKEAKENKVKIIPVDSEHSAIFQCLLSGRGNEVRRIILTMGKGGIAQMSRRELERVSPAEVQNRKVWSMGEKIAVASATGMNKAFEVIEAKYLFGVMPSQIEIVVHPEYLCHSLVEFKDGSIITELGMPDMRRYIHFALFYPERVQTKVSSPVNLIGKKLTFEEPPLVKFPCLSFGHLVLKLGQEAAAVMHGADEVAVKAFIEGKIKFTQIPEIIKKTIDGFKYQREDSLSLAEIVIAEEKGQKFAQELIN